MPILHSIGNINIIVIRDGHTKNIKILINILFFFPKQIDMIYNNKIYPFEVFGYFCDRSIWFAGYDC